VSRGRVDFAYRQFCLEAKLFGRGVFRTDAGGHSHQPLPTTATIAPRSSVVVIMVEVVTSDTALEVLSLVVGGVVVDEEGVLVRFFDHVIAPF
jgi:hypothetical protein